MKSPSWGSFIRGFFLCGKRQRDGRRHGAGRAARGFIMRFKAEPFCLIFENRGFHREISLDKIYVNRIGWKNARTSLYDGVEVSVEVVEALKTKGLP